MPATETFQTHLSVDKSIVEILSKSTYQRNFSYALREMVSNAYDADATRVSIDLDYKAGNLVIQDNGSGMSRDDFQYYLRIAGKRRGKIRTAKFNRKRIGQFGVGFLSVFPFCKIIEVVTTTESSDEILKAEIPAAAFFRRGEVIDVESLPVRGVIYRDPSRRAEHSTTITLLGLTESARIAISRVVPKETKRRSLGISAWSPLEKLQWELSDELPLAFPPASPFRQSFQYSEADLMTIIFNGESLLRNDLGGDLLDSGDITLGGIRAHYAISTPWKAINPLEMRHIKIRMNNVGVGPRTDFDISRVRPYSRLAWLTGELHIVEGLDDMISVSRDTFLRSSQVEELYNEMAARLRKQATYVEGIEESRKTITKHVTHGKQRQVGATKEVVDKNVRKLAEKGFTIERVRATQRPVSEPVQIDRTKKIVRLVEDHPSLEDSVTIGDSSYSLVFEDAHGPNGEPCVIRKDGIVTVFTRYPLFRSKRYGEVFQRMSVLMAVAKVKTRSATEMYLFMCEHMGRLFRPYQ